MSSRKICQEYYKNLMLKNPAFSPSFERCETRSEQTIDSNIILEASNEAFSIKVM